MLQSARLIYLYSHSLFYKLFVSLTLISDPTGTRVHRYNLIPFYMMAHIILHKSLFDIIKNIAGNIILFVPFGFLLPLRRKNEYLDSGLKTVLFL
ncbi:VanZ family protein [Neobacillus drentensis]|uniref:VanZ family protein n=1 Tax=Neobacillus drentensis TaxID=220684 RepID=UPI002FFFB842